jgi:outer membrane protein TolC
MNSQAKGGEMTMKRARMHSAILTAGLVLSCGTLRAQTSAAPPQASPAISVGAGAATLGAGASAPATLTLQDALDRARQNSPQFRAAVTALGVAHEDHVQSRTTLLPSVNFNGAFIYTQGNGTPSARYLANNGVHEYISQGDVHQEVFNASLISSYQRSGALEAMARAEQVIAERGLLAATTESYYMLVTAERKYATAQRGEREAEQFFLLSQRLERGGEAAHSDVVKAELQWKQKQRGLQEAQLTMQRNRLALALLLFPYFNQDFTVVDDLAVLPPLPTLGEVEALGAGNNPQIRAAMAAVSVAQDDVVNARSGYLPVVALDYFYGLDSSHFATKIAGAPYLGYSATATLTVPVWNWGATHSRVKQALLQRDQAREELTYAQRQLLADLQGFYDEADAARNELESLDRSATLAAESLRLTTLRYQGGEATVLEVVDAQNTFVTARDAFDDGQMRYRVALANLQTLTGNF